MTGIAAIVAIDGALVAPEAATISVFDRGLLYGDGLFEVLRTWSGVAVDLAAHLDRLAASARVLELPAIDASAITAAVSVALDAAQGRIPGEHRIRIVVTRGPGALGERLAAVGGGRTIVIVETLPPVPATLAAITTEIPTRRGAGHKTLAYLDHVLCRELAARAGVDEAICVDSGGHIVEGATSNVFAVVDGIIVTPPLGSGALPGIVRARVLAICAREAIAATVRPLAVAELAAASELFVTSSLRGVVPVVSVDGVPRAPGPVAAVVGHLYASDSSLRR